MNSIGRVAVSVSTASPSDSVSLTAEGFGFGDDTATAATTTTAVLLMNLSQILLNGAGANLTGDGGVDEAPKEFYMGTVEATITTIIWILILMTASVGNVLVIVAIFTHPALYIVQNFLLVSLACADILVSVAAAPANYYRGD